MKSLIAFQLSVTMLILSVNSAWAQRKTIDDVKKQNTLQLLTSLNSDSWRERDLAVIVAKERWKQLSAKKEMASKEEFSEKDWIALGLIKRLEIVNIEREKWWAEYAKTEYEIRPPLTDPCGECYLQLVDTVTQLKDKRALNALIGAVDGRETLNGIVGYGKEAVLPLTEKIKTTKNPGLKAGALRALGKILKISAIDTNYKVRIHNVLKEGLNDFEWEVRLGAVEGVSELEDPEFIPLVEETLRKEDINPKTKKMKRNLVKTYGEKTLGKLRAKKREMENVGKNNNSQQLAPGPTQGIIVP